MTRARYFPLLDIVRVVAAVLVLIRHLHGLFGFDFSKSYLAVDLFFVLSGVVVANSYENKLKDALTLIGFIKVRLIRLYPLYIIGLSVAAVGALIVPIKTLAPQETFALTVMGAFMIPLLFSRNIADSYPLNLPSWSLFFEMFINIFYATFLKLLNIRALLALMTLSAAGLVGWAALGITDNLDIGVSPTNFFGGFMRVGYSFFVGVLIYRISDRLPSLRFFQAWPFVTSCLVIAATIMSLCINDLGVGWDLAMIILAFPLIVYVGMQVQFSGLAKRIAAFLGMASYTIYVLHKPLFDFVIEFGMAIKKLPPSAQPTVLIAVGPVAKAAVSKHAPLPGIVFVAALMVLAYLLDRYFERPLREHLRPKPSHRPETVSV